MDGIVDSLEKAYQEFVTAAAIVLETKEANGGKKPEDGVDPSLESLREHLVLFKDTCDEAERFVEYLKHSLGCEKFPDNLSYPPREQVSDDGDPNDSPMQCSPVPIKADDEKRKTDMSASKS